MVLGGLVVLVGNNQRDSCPRGSCLGGGCTGGSSPWAAYLSCHLPVLYIIHLVEVGSYTNL